MATLTEQVITRDGIEPSLSSAAGGGDQFLNTGNQYVEVTNGSGSSITVTFAAQKSVDGLDLPDDTLVVPAGETRKAGPFLPSTFNDSNGYLQITYSGVTSLTVGIFRFNGYA